MFLTWMMLGCKDAAMEAENAKLTQRVADLERTRDRLEKELGFSWAFGDHEAGVRAAVGQSAEHAA